MTSTVLVRLVIDIESMGNIAASEVVAEASRDFYSPDILDELIKEVFSVALERKGLVQFSELNRYRPEVGVFIKSDDGIRPSFHLSREVVSLIGAAGADLDFDPYVFDAKDINCL